MCLYYIPLCHTADTLDDNTLFYEIDDKSNIAMNWSNPSNTLSDQFVYMVRAQLVSSGELVAEETVVITKDSVPTVELSLSQYICQQINITIEIFNTNISISKVVAPPACELTIRISLY